METDDGVYDAATIAHRFAASKMSPPMQCLYQTAGGQSGFLSANQGNGLPIDPFSVPLVSGASLKCSVEPNVQSRLKHQTPPVLWSIPGSGNTWVRQLIDSALSPSLTGSLYNDRGLAAILPGELRCDKQNTVIKAHPEHFSYSHLFDPQKFHIQKCINGGLKGFSSVVVLLRDPVKSIWAEYQRRFADAIAFSKMQRVPTQPKALGSTPWTQVPHDT